MPGPGYLPRVAMPGHMSLLWIPGRFTLLKVHAWEGNSPEGTLPGRYDPWNGTSPVPPIRMLSCLSLSQVNQAHVGTHP